MNVISLGRRYLMDNLVETLYSICGVNLPLRELDAPEIETEEDKG